MSVSKSSGASYEVRVLGVRRAWFRDLYHAALRLSWLATLGVISGVFLGANALFAALYLLTGGIANARPGAFDDAFYFSVQTMGTIGYGQMHPVGTATNLAVVAEAVVGLVITALATGLVFAKFSLPAGRLAFTREAVISPLEGVPTLMFRIGNERGNLVVEAQVRVSLVRTERTREGMTFYRMLDLPLVRERSPAVTRSWTVLHAITPGTPLHGQSPESLRAAEAELIVSVIGTDETSLQPVHGRHTYDHSALRWGFRHVDILSETPDGHMQLDVRRFHDLVAATPTADFPYPAAERPDAGE